MLNITEVEADLAEREELEKAAAAILGFDCPPSSAPEIHFPGCCPKPLSAGFA